MFHKGDIFMDQYRVIEAFLFPFRHLVGFKVGNGLHFGDSIPEYPLFLASGIDDDAGCKYRCGKKERTHRRPGER